MIVNTIRGAQASVVIYSITATARANKLNVNYYISYLLAEHPQLIDAKGNIEQPMLEPLMPWSSTLPVECYSKRRYICRGAEDLTLTGFLHKLMVFLVLRLHYKMPVNAVISMVWLKLIIQ